MFFEKKNCIVTKNGKEIKITKQDHIYEDTKNGKTYLNGKEIKDVKSVHQND